MEFKLRYKIFSLILLTTFISVVILYIFVSNRTQYIDNSFKSETELLLESELNQLVEDMYSTCETANNIMLDIVDDTLRVVEKIIGLRGSIKKSEHTILWKYVDPYTKKDSMIRLPALQIGDEMPDEHTEHSEDAHIQSLYRVIDEVYQLTGNNVSILQPINDNNDLIITATTIKGKNDHRIVRKIIPSVQEDGTINPLVSNITTETIFKDPVYINNTLLIVSARTIFDREGNILAVLVSSISGSYIENVLDTISNLKNRRLGYGFALSNEESNRGDFIAAFRSDIIGTSSLNIKDENGFLIYQSVMKNAPSKDDRVVQYVRDSWVDFSETEPSLKTLAYTYYSPWKWVIGVTSFHSDIEDLFTNIDALANDLIFAILTAGILTLILSGSMALFFSQKISKPITETIEIARNVAKGNLYDAIVLTKSKKHLLDVVNKKDETIQLQSSVTKMVFSLNDLIKKITSSSQKLFSTSKDITISSEIQKNVIKQFEDSGNKIENAVINIQEASNNLSSLITIVSEKGTETTKIANNGKSQIIQIEKTMDEMTKGTFSVSTKLDIIEEQANKINSIIETISKISDQTNLLALNTSIEAEKSGKEHKGFTAISTEIQHLSEQSSIALLSIERIIKGLQESVRSGVTRMNSFKEDINNGMQIINELKVQMENIIQSVESFAPEMIEVKNKSKLQLDESKQINIIIDSFKDLIQNANNSFQSFKESTENLNNSVSTLNNSVSIFDLKTKE